MAMEMDSGQKKGLSRWKKVFFATVLVVFLVAFLELLGAFLYFFSLPKQSRGMIELALGVCASEGIGNNVLHYKPHPYFNYVLNPDYSFPDGSKPYNSYGFRMPDWPRQKIKGTLRIVALGGSTTFGMFATEGEKVWPAMVGKMLNERFPFPIEVYNLGIPGYTTNEILGVLTMLVPVLEPDIVLIHCGANDAFAQAYDDEGGPDNTKFRFSWNYRSLPKLVRFSMRHSYFFRAVGAFFFSRQTYLPGDILKLFQYPPPRDAQALKNVEKADGKYFKRNLKSMVAFIRDLKAAPILINHPLNPKWDAPQKTFYQLIVAAHLRCNRICLEVSKEAKVPFIDLFPLMRDARLFVDALHETEMGMKFKATILAKYLTAFIAAEWQVAPSAEGG